MRVLLDTNVILDAILQRRPWNAEADAILQAAARGDVTCAVTTLSLATVFYVARKIVGTPAARAAVSRCLAAFDILPIDRQALLDADALPGTDFEDNILIAAAVSAALDGIITRNTVDFSLCPLSVWTPADLLSRLPAAGPSSISGTSSTTPPP